MKELVLHGPLSLVETLCRAIRLYAAAAYPAGGSECAQSAREAMLNAAQQLEAQFDIQTETTRMSRRISSHVKAAVDYYYDQPEQREDDVQQRHKELLLSVLKGQRITQEDWV